MRQLPISPSNFLSHLNPRDFNIPHCRRHPLVFFCSFRTTTTDPTCNFAVDKMFLRLFILPTDVIWKLFFVGRVVCVASAHPIDLNPERHSAPETKTLRRQGRRHSIYHQRRWHGEKNKIWNMCARKSLATCKRRLVFVGVLYKQICSQNNLSFEVHILLLFGFR